MISATFESAWPKDFVREPDDNREARLYKLSESVPPAFEGGDPINYIVVSGLPEDEFGPAETCVFLADDEGEITLPFTVADVEGVDFEAALSRFYEVVANSFGL